jgi:hypothetical protein
VLWGAIKTRSLTHMHHAKENNKMDFKKILEQLDAVDTAVKKQPLSEAAFANLVLKLTLRRTRLMLQLASNTLSNLPMPKVVTRVLL